MSNPIGDHGSVLLIGGPDAGKSNFLFRLWIALDGGGGALLKDGLPPEIEYLRGGQERLLEGEFAARTSKEITERVEMHVKCSSPGQASGGKLVVPDLPGEHVLAICRNREWSKEWEDLISSRCACLLFIRAGSDEVVTPLEWEACFEMYGSEISAPGAAVPANQADSSVGSGPAVDEVVGQLPTQVVLTEWLQFLRRAYTALAGGSFRPRVGLVVAAWDAVPADQQSKEPVQYIKDNFPLLYQFVETNDDCFDFQIFGVSIVDGDLKNDEDFKEEYLKGKPQDFGYVLHSLSGKPAKSSDVTLPVAWALRLLSESS